MNDRVQVYNQGFIPEHLQQPCALAENLKNRPNKRSKSQDENEDLYWRPEKVIPIQEIKQTVDDTKNEQDKENI